MERGEFVPLDPERFLQAIVRAARQLCAERGEQLAQCQRCKRVGVQTLRDWEKGTYMPSIISMIKLANALEIDFRELIERAVGFYCEQG